MRRMRRKHVTDLNVEFCGGNIVGTFKANTMDHRFAYTAGSLSVEQLVIPSVKWKNPFWRPGCSKAVKAELLEHMSALQPEQRAA